MRRGQCTFQPHSKENRRYDDVMLVMLLHLHWQRCGQRRRENFLPDSGAVYEVSEPRAARSTTERDPLSVLRHEEGAAAHWPVRKTNRLVALWRSVPTIFYLCEREFPLSLLLSFLSGGYIQPDHAAGSQIRHPTSELWRRLLVGI